MSIKTLAMAAREAAANTGSGDLPYVNSSNELVGTCSALKMFFCEHGYSNTAGSSARLTSPVPAGGTLYATALDTVLSVASNRMVLNASGANVATLSAAPFTMAAADDLLIIIAGQCVTTGTIPTSIILTSGTTSADIRMVSSVANGAGTSDQTDDAGLTPTAGVDHVVWQSWDRSVGAAGLHRNRNQGTVATTATEVTGTTNNATGTLTFDAASLLALRGTNAGMGVFVFPAGTMPANATVNSLANWMGHQWLAKNYVFPRGW
jgi:hypothetical protein